MGQYVSRGGKQYYKGDDGKLYANFRDANLSSSPADQAIRGFGQALQGIPSTVQGAFANVGALLNTPVMRAAVGAPQKGPYDDWLNAPIPKTQLSTSGDADLGGDPGRRGDVDRTLPLPGGRGRVQITSPNTTFQSADEEYKTLLSQYGGTSGVQQLAGMQSLPTGFTPIGGKQAAGLEDYYAAQRAVGAKNIGEITGALAASDPRYQKGGTLEQWAKANPMLAMREFNEKFPAGAPTQGPSDEAIRAAMGSGTYFPSEGSPSPIANAQSLAGQTSFGNIANPVAPAKAWNQGAMVDANRGKENLVPQQEAKTTPDGTMPNLETTAQPQTVLDKTGSFLNNLAPFFKAIAPTGLSSIIYNPYQ